MSSVVRVMGVGVRRSMVVGGEWWGKWWCERDGLVGVRDEGWGVIGGEQVLVNLGWRMEVFCG